MKKPVASRHTIAHILPWRAVGGTEHATLRIARAIDSTRFRSVAFCVPDADPVRTLFTDAGVPTVVYEPGEHSYRHAVRFLRASLRLARDLRRQRVDLVHCADLLAGYQASLAGWLARLPVVCHIRNRFDAISRRDGSFLWPVDKFVFVSRDTWDRFAYRVPASRGTVIYDGIDVPSTGSFVENRRSVCREFDIPEHAPIIGMLARVAPQKDYATLARAAARIRATEPAARFLVVGDHSSGEGYRTHYAYVRQILEEQRVAPSFVFTGHRQDVGRLLSAIDVFVLSTHWEGLPLVILEAMAHGKPVVATHVDGIPEIVDDGRTGLLYPHEDDTRLAAHVIGLLQDHAWAARLAEAARAAVHDCFSTERFATSMSVVYARVLNSA